MSNNVFSAIAKKYLMRLRQINQSKAVMSLCCTVSSQRFLGAFIAGQVRLALVSVLVNVVY